VNWSTQTAPGLPNSSVTDTSDHNKIYTTAAIGSPLKSNANGVVYGKFYIPSGKVATGTVYFGVADANGAYVDIDAFRAAEAGYTGVATTYAYTSFPASHINDFTIIDPAAGGYGGISGGASGFPSASVGGVGGVGGGGVCFIGSSTIAMADGSYKKISDVRVGDEVFNWNKTRVNTVTFLEAVNYQNVLYSPDSSAKPFATVDHPLYIDGKLSSIDPELVYKLYPWIGKTQKIENPITINSKKKIKVYNLWVTNDGTYNVNGYGTTSIIGDGGNFLTQLKLGFFTEEELAVMIQEFTDNINLHDHNLVYGALVLNKYAKHITNVTLQRAFYKAMTDRLNFKRDNKPLTTSMKIIGQLVRIVGVGASLLDYITGKGR
jgi:hypothetical protein